MSQPFPIPSPAEWRAEAEKALKGRPVEGLVHLDADHLTTRPLYGRANATAAVFAPRASDADGRPWDLRTQVEGDDPEAGKFAAYYCKGDTVVAVGTMAMDPIMAKCAELMGRGRMLGRGELEAGGKGVLQVDLVV